MQTGPDLSPDGKWLAYSQRSARSGFDVHALSLTDRHVVPLRSTPANEISGRFSPDGKWLAFTSDETGRQEVYVMAFPAAGVPRVVSAGGGAVPRWGADGHELLYVGPEGHIMSVPVKTGSSLEIGRASVLFAPPSRFSWTDFDVTPDGRFIAVVPLQYAAEQPLTVIVNWPALARGRE